MLGGIAEDEASCWNNLPQEVIDAMLQDLSAPQMWQCRNLGSCWASAVRARRVQIVTHSKPAHLKSQMAKLHNLAVTDSAIQYSFVPLMLLTVQGCAELLRELNAKGCDLPRCKLSLVLQPSEEDSSSTAQDSIVTDISAACVELKQKGVDVCICLEGHPEAVLPSPRLLQQLAPLLQHVIYTQTQDTCRPRSWSQKFEYFSASHVSALEPAKSHLESLCISGRGVPMGSERLSQISLAALAAYTNLKTLHLVCDSPDLGALRHLSLLQDLSLYCPGNAEASCPDVISSSRQHLQSVAIAAATWSLDTYKALVKVMWLQMLRVNVNCLDVTSADVVGQLSVRVKDVQLDDVSQMGSNAIYALTAGCPSITRLQLTNMQDNACRELQTMDYLTALVFNCGASFTGSELQHQPAVEHLDLTDCPMVTNGSLGHMVNMMPAVKVLAISSLAMGQQLWSMPFVTSFVEVSQARNLMCLYLKGMQGACCDILHSFELAVRAQQELGLAQPSVQVHLPSSRSDEGEIEGQSGHFVIDCCKDLVFGPSGQCKPFGSAVLQHARSHPVDFAIRAAIATFGCIMPVLN